MSGIVGIVNFDGAPIDRDLLRRLTDAISFRGPDSQQTEIHNNAGFGHTMLRTTHEAETEKQPLSLDGKIWLTGDIRLDGRRELISKLGKKFSTPPNDAELLLHAYETWQENCVKHLLGDFAFAIWDSTRQRLFCARDQLGVRQFYYSSKQDSFVFSNTLNCLRLHPQVTNKLNELAIGDFLVFGLNQNPSTTIFTDIKRLPKAHSLVVSRDGISVEEYWTPMTTPVRYKNDADYVTRFSDLLAEAVGDRVRTTRAGISMSGGLDSSAIAATARNHDSTLELSAYCVVYDSEFHDEERKYATLVADMLQIPLEFLPGNEINQQATSKVWPEPFDVDPIYVVSNELLRRVSSRARVMLTGWDGDTFLNETPRHSFARSLKTGNLPRLLFDLTRFVYFQHGPPPIGIRTQWRRWRNPHWNRPPFPVWLNDDFARRFNLTERWRELSAETPAHPLRPRAFGTLFSPHWDSLMSRHEAGTTLLPLEVRHPLIDVRVVEYLLALPVIPWLLDKAILRNAMAGILPDAVRLRPKSPLAGDPGLLLRHTRKFQEIDDFKPVSTICSYVDRKSIPRVTDEVNSSQLSINVRPYCLNQWLAYSLS
ncbi:MAG TPA: asparagine synthase-related protein [Pyrinomonadaceae bacterium]|nr:asparagine synthase-related protein [Pyrinomonadaceae bacterium]